jgi:predicted nucleic acid-binding protein
MNILLDTNVVLDVLLAREPWVHEAKYIWQACEQNRINASIVASSVTDIFYIAKRLGGFAKAIEAVELCLQTFAISPIDRVVLEEALLLEGNDFEDNVQLIAAMRYGVDMIVTRNPTDFSHAYLPIVTPTQFVRELQSS